MVVVSTTTRAQNRFAAALVAKVQTPVTQVGQALLSELIELLVVWKTIKDGMSVHFKLMLDLKILFSFPS